MSADAIATGRPDLDALDLKGKQAAYHDFEASTYEDKFKISYDEHVVAYARERFVKAVPEGRVEGRVLELEPRRVDVHYNLGWLHEKVENDLRSAIDRYRTYLDYEPGDEDPRSLWFVYFVVPNRIEALEARLAAEEGTQ